MRCGGYECKKNEKERDWIPDQVGNDRKGCGVSPLDDEREVLAGFRPRAPRFLRSAQDRLFCFGKRTQNHGRPGAALRVPLPQSRMVWAAELAALKQSSPPTRKFGTAAQPRLQAPWMWHLHFLSSPTRSGIQGLCFFLSLRRERHWILACARMTERGKTKTTTLDPRLQMSRMTD